MIMTMPTTSTAPMEPNWPRVCTICGTPSCGPCAACKAMKMAPTKLPSAIARMEERKSSLNTVVASAPVTMVSIMMLEPNQMVNKSRKVP